MYQFTKLMITDGNFIHLDQAQFFAHNYFSFFIINFVTRSVRHTGITAFVITRATDHMKRGAAVCDAELQLPEVREERERERGERVVWNKRDRSNPVFFSPGRKWMGRNLSRSSISHWKLSLQFITNPPGVILFSTDGTSNEIRRYFPLGAIYRW